MATNNITDKLEQFVIEFNERLPRDVKVFHSTSNNVDNIVNIVVQRLDGITVVAYGLIQDNDGSVHWFENLTGRLY